MKNLFIILLFILLPGWSLAHESDSVITKNQLQMWCNVFDIPHPDYTSLSVTYNFVGLECSWNKCRDDSVSIYLLYLPVQNKYFDLVGKAGVTILEIGKSYINFGAGILFKPVRYLIVGAGWDKPKGFYFSLGFRCKIKN